MPGDQIMERSFAVGDGINTAGRSVQMILVLIIIYDTAAKLHIPVLMHVADPAAFFTPKSEKNERWEELDVCPEWDFSDHEKYMSFEGTYGNAREYGTQSSGNGRL